MPNISIMIKPSSSRCNMACEYCFYKDVSSSRQQPQFAFMTDDLAEIIIKKALLYADGDMVSFSFQGGEPLMSGLDFYKKFVDTVNRQNTLGSKIFYAIQTNGTLIDEEFALFFKKNNFLVGLSLDGDLEGNKFRKKQNGQASFYTCLGKAKLLQTYDVDFNILAVLTGYLADNAERIYAFFKLKGFRYIQFIPCLRPFGSTEESEMYMTSEQYASFLIRMFNLYVKDYASGNYISIRQFDNLVRIFLGQMPEMCGMMGYCSSGFVIESEGNVYPCDFYCTDEYFLGNIADKSFQELAKSENSIAFIKKGLEQPEKCKKCKFHFICRGGGCRRTQESEDYCDAYYKFFSSCLPLFRVFIGEK